MIKIAICDDNIVFAMKIKENIDKVFIKKNCDFLAEIYTDEKEIAHIDKQKYDIYFLDVDMGEINGMDLGARIREINKTAALIYISAYQDYATFGYKVKAQGYILKNDVNFDRELQEGLNNILDDMNESDIYISVKNDGEIINLNIYSILYLESLSRKISISFLDGSKIEVYGKISEMEEKLCSHGFLRVHKSYIINLNETKKISNYKAYLGNGKTIPVTKERYAQINRDFVLWKGRF